MDIPTKKILRLLDAEQPTELRRAAALVLGEVAGRDNDVARGLCAALDDPEPEVRLAVIRAVGKLRTAEALPILLERAKDGGEEAHAAIESAAKVGAKGVKALQEMMPRVAPGVRKIIAGALAAGSAVAPSVDAALTVLQDKDPNIVEAAVRSLSEQVPTLDAHHRSMLVEQLLNLLADRKANRSSATENAAVRLLAALGDERAEPILWDRIQSSYPAVLRATALQALGDWIETPNKEQLKRLLACAAEREFRVAAPAIMILSKLPVTDKQVPDWLELFQAGDVAGRMLALEKVGDRDTAEVAEALLEQIRHPDRALREAALARLAKHEHGRKTLTRALLETPTVDQAWTLARTQAPFVRDYPTAWRDEVFEHASEYIEKEDRRADPLLFLLREADAHDLRDRLEARALHWRKKKKYSQALHYLRLLTRDPACGFPIRLELAACGLKLAAQDLSAEARAAEPCLQQYVKLCQQDEAGVLDHLGKCKWLEPEELYYLGFHLAEQEGRPKKCAAEVLKLVVKASPRSKLAQAAKSKLKSSGLD